MSSAVRPLRQFAAGCGNHEGNALDALPCLRQPDSKTRLSLSILSRKRQSVSLQDRQKITIFLRRLIVEIPQKMLHLNIAAAEFDLLAGDPLRRAIRPSTKLAFDFLPFESKVRV